MATACGSCHIGGSLVEKDRNGVRHAQRPMDMTGATYNAYDNYVLELFNPITGLPEHYNNPFDPTAGTAPGFGVAYAMWAYPATTDNEPYDGTNALKPSLMGGDDSNAFIQGDAATNAMIGMGMAEAGQVAMPNVREMDCFFCHLEGYNNVVSSVATQMGYLNAAPALGSGLMNMFSMSYMPGTFTVDGNGFASLSGSMLNRLKAEPPTDNCRQCHVPENMANFSDMFDKFLAAAPMSYEPTSPYASPLNGLAMPTYDLNAAFVSPVQISPSVSFDFQTMSWVYSDASSAAGPFGIFPMALDTSWSMFNPDGTPNTGTAGGAKPGMSGPLYYAGGTDQNALKKATIPFPRADWFKRGDLWGDGDLEVHSRLGCGGCHFNAESLNPDLNQCDPGRGHVRMGGIEHGQFAIDTRDTMKTCRDCHITGTNIDGQPINTFGAPNPTAAHTAAGLTAKIATAMGLDAGGNETTMPGDHLDVVDCSVCHIYKKSMAVRALDSTSGNRYPSMIGLDYNKGMMGMFTDPMAVANMDDGTAIGVFTQNMQGMGYVDAAISGMLTNMAAMWVVSEGEAARRMLTSEMKQWQPLYGWHANAPKTLRDGSVNTDWRRKVIPINMITAQLWDDAADSMGLLGPVTINDANGDGGEAAGQTVLWDPWIQRDMKAGMNFAAGPFATIPVGFGTGAYQSAYNPDFTFSGAFKYVGAYGGNIILTTPEEISEYKNLRGTEWDNTQLVFFGGNPFQVTHNVVATSKHALGKRQADGTLGCTDCHAPGTGFFSGGYDMTGSGIPASPTYDVDGSGTMATAVASNMMQRPIVDYEVVADEHDLRTGSEAKRKSDGAVLDVEFDEHGCWDGATFYAVGASMGADVCDSADPEYGFKQTKDLERAEFLYPEATEASPSWTSADGSQTFTALSEWTTYLENLGVDGDGNGTIDGIENGGFGVDPVAAGFTCSATDTDADGVLDATAATDVTFTAPGQGVGSFSYTWSFSDGTVTNAAATTRQFSKQGTYQAVLTVMDEEGKVARELKYITIKAPLPGTANFTVNTVADTTNGGFDADLTLVNLPAGYDAIRVFWGDSSSEWQRDNSDPLLDQLSQSGSEGPFTHDYATAAAGETVSVKVLVYQSGTLLANWAHDVTF